MPFSVCASSHHFATASQCVWALGFESKISCINYVLLYFFISNRQYQKKIANYFRYELRFGNGHLYADPMKSRSSKNKGHRARDRILSACFVAISKKRSSHRKPGTFCNLWCDFKKKRSSHQSPKIKALNSNPKSRAPEIKPGHSMPNVLDPPAWPSSNLFKMCYNVVWHDWPSH